MSESECIKFLESKIGSLLAEVDALSKTVAILKVGGCHTTTDLGVNTATNCCCKPDVKPVKKATTKKATTKKATTKKATTKKATTKKIAKKGKKFVKKTASKVSLSDTIRGLITEFGPMSYKNICKALPQFGHNSISAILSQNFKKGPQDPKSRGVLWKL